MKHTAVTGNLTQLTRFGMVNAFLVREDDGFTLVDTMVTGSAKPLMDAASAAGAPIVRLLVTHAHDDHVGSLVALAKALPEAEVIASKRDAKLMRGDQTGEPGEPDGKLLGSYKPLDVVIDRELDEGDRVGSLEVIGAEGHSPGQVAFRDPRDGALIAGDAFSSLGGLATTAGPYWKFPLPGFVTWDRPTALKSAIKLRDLEPSVLVVGHGKPTKNPVPAMTAAIKRRS
ncbi:MAG: MBL fold metallo-hydrolase [Solirubrobacterales bacterium]|nr:MBL fold metallo-hydrolase [Solirubrobacterales bacterium]